MTDDIIVSIEHVSAGYGARTVFQDVSLAVRERDFMGVVGPNGGGKTTLIRMLLGLMKPSSGRIRYFRNGRQVKSLVMGYLPQYNAVDKKFPISVGEVVLSGLNNRKSLASRYSEEHREQARQVLTKLGMEDAVERHIGTLSGGQLQRVLLARAIVSRPEIVILDEPNTYIDRRFQEQMYGMLHSINRDCAIVLVSHDLGAVVGNVRNIALVRHAVRSMPVGELSGKDIEGCFGCSPEIFMNGNLADICAR